LKGLETQTEPKPEPEKGDKIGPVSIAVAVNTPAPPDDAKPDDPKTPPQVKLVVFGDSDFASDAFSGPSSGNIDLFLNTVSWLTAQENLISIRPKEPGNSRLMMTPTQILVVNWIAMLGIPLMVFVVGIATWSRRRRS
jgi:ABC-type uncharacterized transport system involved in gliding motility auxiliary subunit